MGHEGLLSGWLRKRGGGHRSSEYRQRWFVLTIEGIIRYYRKPTGDLQGEFSLTEETVVVETGELTFEVTASSGRTFHIKADSKSSRDMWFRAIKAGCRGTSSLRWVDESGKIATTSPGAAADVSPTAPEECGEMVFSRPRTLTNQLGVPFADPNTLPSKMQFLQDSEDEEDRSTAPLQAGPVVEGAVEAAVGGVALVFPAAEAVKEVHQTVKVEEVSGVIEPKGVEVSESEPANEVEMAAEAVEVPIAAEETATLAGVGKGAWEDAKPREDATPMEASASEKHEAVMAVTGASKPRVVEVKVVKLQVAREATVVEVKVAVAKAAEENVVEVRAVEVKVPKMKVAEGARVAEAKVAQAKMKAENVVEVRAVEVKVPKVEVAREARVVEVEVAKVKVAEDARVVTVAEVEAKAAEKVVGARVVVVKVAKVQVAEGGRVVEVKVKEAKANAVEAKPVEANAAEAKAAEARAAEAKVVKEASASVPRPPPVQPSKSSRLVTFLAASGGVDTPDEQATPPQSTRTRRLSLEQLTRNRRSTTIESAKAAYEAEHPSSPSLDVWATLERVESGTAPTFEISTATPSLARQCTVLTAARKTELLSRLADAPSTLTTITLSAAGLDDTHATALARLLRLPSLLCANMSSNNLTETGLLVLAETMLELGASLGVTELAIAPQSIALSTLATSKLLDSLEACPHLTKLGLGTLRDDTVRNRYEALTMANTEALRQRRRAATTGGEMTEAPSKAPTSTRHPHALKVRSKTSEALAVRMASIESLVAAAVDQKVCQQPQTHSHPAT